MRTRIFHQKNLNEQKLESHIPMDGMKLLMAGCLKIAVKLEKLSNIHVNF